MDQGQVVEYDTPLALFDQPESIFRGMVSPFWRRTKYGGSLALTSAGSQCEKAHLTRADIVRIRLGAGKADE